MDHGRNCPRNNILVRASAVLSINLRLTPLPSHAAYFRSGVYSFPAWRLARQGKRKELSPMT